MTPLADLADVAFSYGARVALDGISLSVNPGEIVGLVGPNASGKSTLARVACGLVAPSRGSAKLGGDEASRLPRREAARRAAFVPQLLPGELPYTALEVALMGRAPHLGLLAVESQDDEAIARASLEAVGIAGLAGRAFDTLSGGERQLCVLARALSQRTPLLVLDEPTSALDLAHQETLARVVKLEARAGRGALVVLHDLSLAAALCSRLVLLAGGRALSAGTPAEVLTEALLERAYGVRPRVLADPRTGAPLVAPPID